jgi:hypothetical protein
MFAIPVATTMRWVDPSRMAAWVKASFDPGPSPNQSAP